MGQSGWAAHFIEPLATADPALARLLADQRRQNDETVNLVASESYCCRAALEAEASSLVNKNASGYPPRRSVGGGEILDAVERLAIARARTLFQAEHANIQALSSTIANIAVLRGLLAPGDRILALDATAGGHGSHGQASHISGQTYRVENFGVDEAAGGIDYAAVADQAARFGPRMIVAGATAYPKMIDFARLGRIATSVGAMLFADIAHVSGLVAAGLHPNPTPFADAVTTSTHKTLCGPRTGGLILCKAAHGAAIDAALSPGLQAAAGAHIIAARALLFDWVAQPWFAGLMGRVLENARALAEGLAAEGVPLYLGGTETHMVVVDLRGTAWTPAALGTRLLEHGIVASTTRLPGRDGAAVGLRLGSTAMTIRGADAALHREIGGLLARLLRGTDDPADAPAGERLRRIAADCPIPFQGT